MSEPNTERLPSDVVERAIRIIETQGPTPRSPGERRGDCRVALCAAAALAAAGLDDAGADSRRFKFEENLVAFNSSEPIREVFKELGWSVELCNRVVIVNDSFTPSQRQWGVIQLLRRLQTA